jgi:hypothetical protein
MKSVWKGIKQLITLKYAKNTNHNLLKIGFSKIVEKKAIAEAFSKYFSTKGSHLESTIPLVNTPIERYMTHPLCNSFAIFSVTVTEIIDEISRLNPSKSIGPYNIPVNLLKILNHMLAQPLIYLSMCLSRWELNLNNWKLLG